MAATDSEDPGTEPEGDYLQEIESIEYIAPEGDDTTCNICYAEFLDSEDLTVHVNQVHKKKSKKPQKVSQTSKETPVYRAVCQFCDHTYKDADAYARHVCHKHLVQMLCCRVCTKCFTDGSRWKKHVKKHNSKCNLYACSQCIAVFSTTKEVELHEAVNHDNVDDGVLLSCMPELSAMLKQNAVAFLKSDDRILKCMACKFTSQDVRDFLQQCESCIVYVCSTCCYVAGAKKNLVNHLGRKKKCRSPKEYNVEMTTCPICKVRLNCKQMLAHAVSCNKYKCHVCDIRFESIEHLSKHQTEVHPVELDVIKCKYCFREFVGQDSLDKHIKRSHSHQFILYKYKCMTCEQIFKHPQLLFAHYFTKHKELEPYTCRICDKKFKVRKRFTIHIKMDHKSAGVVEFDEQYHVFFTEKKSENPFIPKCVIPELVPPDNPTPSIKIRTQKEINAEVSNKEMPTETEIDDENDSTKKPKRRGKKRKVIKAELSSSEEEEVAPLSMIKKRAERKHFRRLFPLGAKKAKQNLNQRKQFTCKTCNKYCYTFQNYHNHIQIHRKENIKCIKCSKIFKSKTKLSEHMAKNHSTSRLIETLKNVLERKQFDNNDGSHDRNEEDLTPTERFMKTIKKVRSEKQTVAATISPAGNLSVKNFIENFVPEVGETANVESTEKNDSDEPVVILKHYDSPFYRKHSIAMTKFIPEPPQTTFKLKMPERFKAQPVEKVKLRVKLVHEPIKVSMFEQLESFHSKFSQAENQEYEDGHVHEDHTDHHDDHDHYQDGGHDIPEVAEEVMLEGSEEPPKPNLQAPHKIVIPKLPDGYPKIHIATLQPQAPFFKIITVKNSKNDNEAIVIDTDTSNKVKQERDSFKKKDVISLPDGTKFVTTNPLAHLLGGKPVEELQVSTKYYKPAPKNFKGLFAEALQNLDKPMPKSKKQKKKAETDEKPPESKVLDNKGPGKSLPLL